MQTNTKARMPALDVDKCDDEQKELMRGWRTEDGNVPNLIRVFVRHPALLKAWFKYGMHVMQRSTLPARDRELVIMRVAWLNDSTYEWGHHAIMSRAVGITDDELKRVTLGPDAAGWTAWEKLLLTAVDEMKKHTGLSDATYDALAEVYDDRQMIDLVHTFGAYNMVSMSLNIFGVQLEDNVEGIEKFR